MKLNALKQLRALSSWMLGVFIVAASPLPALAQALKSVTKPEESPSVASPKPGYWLEMHEKFLKRAKEGKIDLLFLGDSITEGWYSRDGQGHGPREIWERHYAPRNAANFGIGGDRVQNVLWRVEHGELEGIKPKVVVLMIGTNNVNANTPAEVAEGIETLLGRIRAKLPETKILLLGVFPRSRKADTLRERNNAVNERIRKLDDGKVVKYLDLGPKFIHSDGSIPPEIMPDALHLSREGYRIWADAMEPTLSPLLGES